MDLLFNKLKEMNKVNNIDIAYISIFCTSIVIIIYITIKVVELIVNNEKIESINKIIHKIKNNQDELNLKINELYNIHDNNNQLYNIKKHNNELNIEINELYNINNIKNTNNEYVDII